MKATLLAVFAFAFSVTAYADQPGNGYPDEPLPVPVEQPYAEPYPRPCATPCAGGNVYQQVPQKICQVVPLRRTRIGTLYGISRNGQMLTLQLMDAASVGALVTSYQRMIERYDGRPVCEVVY